MKATFLLLPLSYCSYKNPRFTSKSGDVGAHQFDRAGLHGLWQCERGEYFPSKSLVRSYKYKDGGEMQPTNFQCRLSFPSVQALTFAWLQSLLQQVIGDMKKAFGATLEMEARIQNF